MPSSIAATVGQELKITAPPGGTHGVYLWEKLIDGTWTNVSSQNQSSTPNEFVRTSSQSSDDGTYRYTVSNTWVPDLTFESGPIEVLVEEAPVTSVKALYNGMITSVRWRTDKVYGSDADEFKGMYVYDYDDKYQVEDASWATPDFALNTFQYAGNKYRTTGMSYDANGNIQSLKRYNENGTRTHNFSYRYGYHHQPSPTYNNQLQSVEGYVSAYTYNDIGQTIAVDKTADGEDQYIDYDVAGKVRFVYSDAAKQNKVVEYLYDDRGFRLAKVDVPAQRTTWYIRDASGQIMSVYEQAGTPNGLSADVSWASLNNIQVDEEGNMTMVAGASEGSAVSSTRLKPNQDGYFEYRIEDVSVPKNMGFRQVGGSNSTWNYFNFYGPPFNLVTMRKGGSFQGSISYSVGDVIRLERVGGAVRFYHNNVLKHSISQSASLWLELYFQFESPAAKVSGLKFVYLNDPTQEQFVLTHTEVPIYGAGKLGTYYPAQDASVDYELTDHLGNVRALLREGAMVMTATMEDSNVEDYSNPRVQEMAYFQNLFETEVNDVNMNHTSGTATAVQSPSRSAYLFWQDGIAGMEASDKAIGPAMARSVSAGDVITAEVYARYENKTGYTNEGVTLSMLSSLLGSTFVSVGGFEGMSLPQTVQSFSNALGAGAFLDDTDDEVPYAYLNYIIFDEEMTHVASDRVRVTEAGGFDPGEESLPDMHERIGLDNDIVIPTEGKYIYIWVSNESENTKVWFDDLRISHASTFVAQATDYGVWGDVIREEKSDVLSRYRYAYQGQYAERDEETGWNHFELREYDPIIGRWTAIDPAGQYWSPYLGMGNDPVSGVDPDGAYSKLGAWWRNGFSMDGVYESYEGSGNWGYNTSKIISVDGADQAEITGHFGYLALSEGGKAPVLEARNQAWDFLSGQRTAEVDGRLVDVDYLGYASSALTTSGTADFGAGPARLKGGYTVYKAIRNGKIVYWGMTKNFVKRTADHAARGFDNIVPAFENVSRSVARGVEQIQIETHGLKNLENVINGISKNNPKLMQYYRDAVSYFQTLK